MGSKKGKEVQDFLTNWLYYVQRIRQLEDRINEMQISVTASYELSGVTSSLGGSSKIESHYIRKEKLQSELSALNGRIEEIENLVSSELFTYTEKDILRCLMYGVSLRDYAARRGIYKSYIYKIKDSAIDKLAMHLSDNTF